MEPSEVNGERALLITVEPSVLSAIPCKKEGDKKDAVTLAVRNAYRMMCSYQMALQVGLALNIPQVEFRRNNNATNLERNSSRLLPVPGYFRPGERELEGLREVAEASVLN